MAEEQHDTWGKLIKLCLEGKEQAFKEIYERLAPKMYTVALRYMNNENDAQDVLQEAFIRIYQKLNSFQFAGSFEGWCRRIIVNTAIEHLRRSKSNITDSLDDVGGHSVSEISLSRLQLKDVLAAIRQMPDGYRTVFNMFVIEGYSHQEIAEHLGVSLSTSKSQLFKARNYLQQLLEKQK
ncbi:MAG: sigma-70 family RNA polymerase sigma factor [Flavobacteriales bacterium]|nr:sigma-70 family RNA polymerase sigma factor [Flavobacteriales bacterium]